MNIENIKEEFKSFLEESNADIIIDWASEEKGLDKKLSKKYGITIKDTGRMEASVVGDKKKIIKFLTSVDYDVEMEDLKDMFPELF